MTHFTEEKVEEFMRFMVENVLTYDEVLYIGIVKVNFNGEELIKMCSNREGISKELKRLMISNHLKKCAAVELAERSSENGHELETLD